MSAHSRKPEETATPAAAGAAAAPRSAPRVVKPFSPLFSIIPEAALAASQKAENGSIPDDRLRDEGFRAVRLATGPYLSRILEDGDIALDAFMLASGQYPAIALNWMKLRTFAPDITEAREILDLSCGTGMVANFIIQTHNPGAHVTANEVSPDLLRLAARNLEEYLGAPEGGKRVTLSCFDPSSQSLAAEYPSVRPESFDLILWWGSFQTLAGRGQVLSNTFDLLRPGGRFVIMDVYPTFPIPFGYVGAEGSKLISFVSCPLDMSSDVKGWVRDKWMAKMDGRMRNNPHPRIEVIEFAEQLKGDILPADYWGEMRSICFKKPCHD